MKKFKPRKFLYLVHRQQIAEKALASFAKVLGEKGKTTKKKQYGEKSLISIENNKITLSEIVKDSLNNRKLFEDAIETGIIISKQYDQKSQFTLYQKYSRKDVCRLLNWQKDVSAPMYGYRVDEKNASFYYLPKTR